LPHIRKCCWYAHNALEIPSRRVRYTDDKVDLLGAALSAPEGPTDSGLYVGPKALSMLGTRCGAGITGAEPDLRAIMGLRLAGNQIRRTAFLWLKWMYIHIVANCSGRSFWQTLVPHSRCAAAAFADEVRC